MWNEALWLGVPRAEIEEKKIYQGDMNGRFAYYRLDFMLDQRAELKADISANSRYRLWVNGQPVLSGPCRRAQPYPHVAGTRRGPSPAAAISSGTIMKRWSWGIICK